MMKKIVSLSLSAMLVFGMMTFNVFADTADSGVTTLIDIDFESETLEQLKSNGDVVVTEQTGDVIEIADISTDLKLNTGGHSKALHFEPGSGQAGSKIEFPLDYTLNENEKLYVEYDYNYYPIKPADWDGASHYDCFSSSHFGDIGVVTNWLTQAGQMKHKMHSSNVGTGFHDFSVGANTTALTGDTASDYAGWVEMRIEYDYAAYKADMTNKGFSWSAKSLGRSFWYPGTDEVSGVRTIGTSDTSVSALTFDNTSGDGNIYIDNVKVYTIREMLYTSSVMPNGKINNKTVKIKFSNTVSNADAISIKADGVNFNDFNVDSNGSEVTVTFNNLAYATTYSIDVNGVADVNGQVVSGVDDLIFTTENEPDISIKGDIKYSSGVGEAYCDDILVNELGSIELTLQNNTSDNKNATVFYLSYDADGIMRDITYTDVTLKGKTARKVVTGVTLTDGGKVTVYVWNSVSEMTPYFRHVSKSY